VKGTSFSNNSNTQAEHCKYDLQTFVDTIRETTP
jgi:hypothetical protein